MVGLLHQLPAGRADALRQMARGILFRTPDVEQIGGACGLPQPALKGGAIDKGDSGAFRQLSHRRRAFGWGAKIGVVAPLLGALKVKPG